MRRWLGVFFWLVGFLALLVVPTQAAVMLFEPSTANIPVGQTQKIKLQVDPKGTNITSADAWIIFDPALVTIAKDSAGKYDIQQGNLFQKMNFNLVEPGRLYIYGLLNDIGESRNAIDTMAIINFEVVGNGSTTIKFDCQMGVAESSKIIKNDINATNVIECGGNGKLIINQNSSSGKNTNSSRGGSYASIDNSGNEMMASLDQLPIVEQQSYQQEQEQQQIDYSDNQLFQQEYIPDAGNIENVLIMLGLGGGLTFLGIFLRSKI